MDMWTKISPAFEPFMSGSGPHDRRDAIVMFEPANTEATAVRGSLRTLKHRLDMVGKIAAQQVDGQTAWVREFQAAGTKQMPGKGEFRNAAIGSGSLPMMNVAVTRKTLPELACRPEVRAIMPNQRIHLIQPKAVEYNTLTKQEAKDGMTWGLKMLDIPKLWETTKGKSVNVAVLDTGVYGAHPALNGRIKGFIAIDPLGNRITATPSFDADKHGTHVCGTIAGGKADGQISIGVAPEANLFVAAVLMGGATLRSLLEGISWAVESGADIISMSLGFTYYEPLFAEVFDVLINQYNIVPVVAAGNENHGNTSSPGNAYNALAVGAVEKMSAKKMEVAAFSSGASLVFPGQANHELVHKPDVVAPGAQVFSSIPPEKTPTGEYHFTYMDGTSMATPHVAGVAALLMAAKPRVQAKDIIGALADTAKHPNGNAMRPDNRWGNGLIQPEEALKALS